MENKYQGKCRWKRCDKCDDSPGNNEVEHGFRETANLKRKHFLRTFMVQLNGENG